MPDKKYPQYYVFNQERLTKSQKLLETRKTPNNLRQDKRALPSTCIASLWPSCSTDEWHVRQLGSFSIQAKTVNTIATRLVKMTLYVKPGVKLWAMREAAKLGVSLSSFCARLFEMAAKNHISLEVGPDLQSDITTDIRQEMAIERYFTTETGRDVQMIKQLLSYNLEYTAGKEKIENLLSLAHARANEEMANRKDKLYGKTGEQAKNSGEHAHTAGEELDSLPLEKITFYVKIEVKTWASGQAAKFGLRLSSFASPLFEKAAQHENNLQASPELKPVFKKLLRSEFRGGRQLTAQTAHDVQMVKQLLSYLLEHTPGIGTEKLKQLLEIATARAEEEIKNRQKIARENTADALPERARPQGAIYARDTKHEAKGADRDG